MSGPDSPPSRCADPAERAPDPDAPGPGSLLVHGPRLRALALQLVGDAHRADDLVQETWTRALERRPSAVGPSGRSLFPWLATVLRNLAVQGRRERARREARERVAARPEASGPADRAHARFRLHRELVDAIEKLGEPYREAILLRYFDGLPPRRIATRLGLPVKTVKTRLHRGLAMLRANLDREHGDRATWVLALAPLVAEAPRLLPPAALAPSAATGSLAGVLAMSTQAKLALAVLAAAGLYLCLPGRRDELGPASADAAPRVPAAPLASGPAPSAASGAADLAPRQPVGAPAPDTPHRSEPHAASHAAETPPAAAPRLVRGRVYDARGMALAGVEVGLDPAAEGASALSAVGGGFEIPLPERAGTLARIVSHDPLWATAFTALWSAEPGDGGAGPLPLVVAPRIALAGVVVDEADRPVADAHVRIRLPEGLRARFPFPLDHAKPMDVVVRSDADGRFACADLPAVEGLLAEAVRSGVGRATLTLPLHDDDGLRLVLVPEDRDELFELYGQVLDERGEPAPGAHLALGRATTRADGEGRFLLRALRRPPEERVLIAVAPGALPGRYEPQRTADGEELWPAHVLVRLGAAPLAFRGRVLDPTGAPLAGAVVWIDDPTYFAATEEGLFLLETVMRGGLIERWTRVRTDADGRFELAGMQDREYALVAMDDATKLATPPTRLRPGRGEVELRLPADGLFERVEGRVVDRFGHGIEGLHVRAVRQVLEVETPQGGVWGSNDSGAEATTGADGRFALEDVPRAGVVLEAEGDAILPRGLPVEDLGDPLDVALEVALRCHVQLEATRAIVREPGRVASFEVRDAEDESILIHFFAGRSQWMRWSGELTGGRSAVFSVPDTAAEVVLFDAADQELARVPLALTPDGLNRVEL